MPGQFFHWKREDKLNRSILLQLLREKLSAVDIEQIKKDVQPFLKDKQELELWNRDFFLNIIKFIEVQEEITRVEEKNGGKNNESF